MVESNEVVPIAFYLKTKKSQMTSIGVLLSYINTSQIVAKILSFSSRSCSNQLSPCPGKMKLLSECLSIWRKASEYNQPCSLLSIVYATMVKCVCALKLCMYRTSVDKYIYV